jgi:signal transduction histidine kinase
MMAEPTTQEKLDVALAALHRCEERGLAGLFALEVMHEVRNPLDALTNLLHLAAGEMDLANVHQYTRDAQDQISSLHEIAGQSLTLARVHQSEKPIDILTLVEAAVKVHHRRIAMKQARIVRDFSSPESITVKAGEIVQVLSNLIGNALDAISNKGIIALRVRRRKDVLCLLIADDGCGISPENARRLFEPFFTTKKDQGNGLGLALSKKILDRHRGSSRVRSSMEAKRRGTCFRLCLPATE